MNFRLVPKSVTLNDLERRYGLILPYFAKLGSFQGPLRKNGWWYTDTFCKWNAAQKSSFKRYIIYGDIRRESPPARALKWSDPCG